MTNIAKIEKLLKTISEENGRDPGTAVRGIVAILRKRSDEGDDHKVVDLLKEVFLELAMEEGAEADFTNFCLNFISRINVEFNILLN